MLPYQILTLPSPLLLPSTGGLTGRLYLAKPYSAKSESAVQESAKPYSAKPESAKPISGIC